MVSQENLLDKLPASIERTVCCDRDWHFIAEQSSANLNLTPKADDLAHVVYTSGSTGKPSESLTSFWFAFDVKYTISGQNK